MRAARYHREATDQRLLSIHAQNVLASRLEYADFPHLAAFGNQIANEILDIAVGLEADNVVLYEQRDQLFMVRQRGQNFRRWKRNMQEESNPVAMPTAAQRICDRYEMVVMDPDQIVSLDDLFEFGGEMIIDLEISAQIPTRELRQVEPVMQDWP